MLDDGAGGGVDCHARNINHTDIAQGFQHIITLNMYHAKAV